MGYTTKWQFHTEGSHFWRQMVTIDFDGFSTSRLLQDMSYYEACIVS